MRRVSVRQRKRTNRLIAVGCYALTILLGAVVFWQGSQQARLLPGLVRAQPHEVVAFDVTSLPPCPGEAGPVDRTPRLACTWDAATQGIQGPRLYDARWLVYLPTCPVPFDTVQNRALVQCIEMNDWGE